MLTFAVGVVVGFAAGVAVVGGVCLAGLAAAEQRRRNAEMDQQLTELMEALTVSGELIRAYHAAGEPYEYEGEEWEQRRGAA